MGTFFMSVSPASAESDVLERSALESVRASTSVLIAVTRSGQRLVAAGERGMIVLSDDSGVTWRQARVPVSVSLTGIAFPTASKGWAVGHGGVVLSSNDGGETWTKQLDGRQVANMLLEAAKAGSPLAGKDTQAALAEANRLVADGPDKPFLDVKFFDSERGLIVGAFGMVLSTDNGGKTWQPALDRLDNPGGKHLNAISIADRDVYLVGEHGIVFRSSDGGRKFVELKTPYAGTYFGALAVDSNSLIVFGLRGQAYRSGDRGTNWQKVDAGTASTLTAGMRLDDGSLVLADESGRLLYSRDSGLHFKPLRVPRPYPFTGIVQATDSSLNLSGVRGMTRFTLPTLLEDSTK